MAIRWTDTAASADLAVTRAGRVPLVKRGRRDADWARLLTVFPDGVCDFDRPGVDERPMAGTWASFGAPGSWMFLEPGRTRRQ